MKAPPCLLLDELKQAALANLDSLAKGACLKLVGQVVWVGGIC